MMNSEVFLLRIYDICEYFNSNLEEFKNYLKTNNININLKSQQITYGVTKIDPSKLLNSIKVDFDEEGNVKYPIIVTGSLKILNLGIVDWERPNYHSVRNIFPIGFKSVRDYQSMFFPNKRCDYVCEILDGGNSPLFKVTSMEDPDNPIIRDASSGAWIYIC